MKKQLKQLFSTLLLFLVILCVSEKSYAQMTVSMALTQAPCDHDGILTATVVGGTAPYTYSWSLMWSQPPIITTSNTLTNYSGANNVGLKVTDASGANAYSSYQPTGVPFGVQLNWANCTPAHCPNNDGALAFNVTGGTAPFSYIWYNNGVVIGTTTVPSINNLAPGFFYDVEITDANGCKIFYHDISDSLAVWSVSSIVANITTTPANCLNGTATLNPSGGLAPYTYSWYETYPVNQPLSSTTNTVSNLVSNHSYGYTITDAQGCMDISGFYANTTTSFYANVSTNAATCLSSNGAINLTLVPQSGASLAPPHTYSWSNNTTTTTPNLSGIPAGPYFCQITDANGCETTSYINLTASSPISATIATTMTSSCITPNGTATVNPSGGLAPYSYSWNTGATTQTASGLDIDTYYSVYITDANGCTKQKSTTVTYSNQGTYILSTTPDVCSAGNGTATPVITGGVAPFSYSWTNGQTTQTATNLYQGYHFCDIIDANGCHIPHLNNNWNNYYVSYSSPVVISGSANTASCYYTADGSVTAIVTGGTPPYQYQWAGTNQTTATITGLSTGNYYLLVTDAAGCKQYHSFYVGYNGFANCTGTIKGYVYADLNLNCIKDAGENGVAGVQVYCNPFGGSEFTNAQGYYEFTVPIGSYQVQHFPLAYYNPNCPVGTQTVNVPAAGMSVWANFGDEVTLVQDLEINTYNTMPMIPGGTFQQIIQLKNTGTVAVNSPLLHLHNDPNVNLNITAGFNIAGPNYYTKNYTPLAPNQTLNQYLTYTVPLSTTLGNVLLFETTIDPSTAASGEFTPWNNTDYYNATVVGSYDPNYKEVFPKGKGPQGFIYKEDSILEYIIHFQNTGNYPATTVVLKDTLDSDLDWTTVSMGYSTHEYTAKISMDNVLEITFDNINLADSFSNVQESMGLVAFKIKQKKGLPVGTEFTNAADIFFDYNYPIHTNTVLNTLMATSTSGVTEELENTLSLKVYPNPTADKLTVETPSEWQGKTLTVRCLDIMGREMSVKEEANQEKMSLNVANLPTGWYMLQVSDGKTLLTQKFSVVK